MQVSFQELMNAVKQLSAEEKNQLNEVLWSEDMAVPSEHQSLVNERIKKSTQTPERIVDWNSASKTLRS
jgi:hypothetical protein